MDKAVVIIKTSSNVYKTEKKSYKIPSIINRPVFIASLLNISLLLCLFPHLRSVSKVKTNENLGCFP